MAAKSEASSMSANGPSPQRSNSVGGSAGGNGASITPALPSGCRKRGGDRPNASTTAETPVGVARTIGSPSSIAR